MMASMKKPLEPLIPLDELRKVLAQIVAVQKDNKAEAKPKRRPRKQPKPS
jgi:hypothetical protein